MKCPHLAVTIHSEISAKTLTEAANSKRQPVSWQAKHSICPHCKQLVIWLACIEVKVIQGSHRVQGDLLFEFLAWPQSSTRPVPKEVPEGIRRNFAEAVQVLTLSPQSSAALTRRLLQEILRDYANTTKRDLFDQIQEVLDSGHLPSSLADQLHAVRAIGNFAAHPLKSQNTGQIVPVEPNEAEWNLDVLEDVFDFYFVKPAKAQARIAALNAKLAEVGKLQLP
jgi:hypothetical protein